MDRSRIGGAELDRSSKAEGCRFVLDSVIHDTLPKAPLGLLFPLIRIRFKSGRGLEIT